jgi:hypothetical protein
MEGRSHQGAWQPESVREQGPDSKEAKLGMGYPK